MSQTLEQVYKPIRKELEKVEDVIKKQLKTVLSDRRSQGINDKFIEEVTIHLFRKPGKKLRPALVLMSAGIFGAYGRNRRKALVELAAAVELIHSASLIHDDIIDDADQRRHEVSMNKQFDNTIAVLTGDILYAQFFSLLTHLPDIDDSLKLGLFGLFSRLTRNMCIGEIFQHEILNRRFLPDEKEYLKVLENKTALLMSACCECGARVNEAEEESARHLGNFGLNFGLAFQLVDDYIDRDSPLKAEVDLLHKAESYIDKARKELGAVSTNGRKIHLENLCDFVLSRAKVKQPVG